MNSTEVESTEYESQTLVDSDNYSSFGIGSPILTNVLLIATAFFVILIFVRGRK